MSIGFNNLEAIDDQDKSWGWKPDENSLDREY